MKALILIVFILLSSLIGSGVEKIDSLRNKLAGVTNAKNRAVALLKISDYYWDTDLDSARFYADKANILAEKEGYQQAIAQANLYNGIAELLDSHSEKSKTRFDKSLAIYSDLGDRAGISKCYNNLGIYFNMQGNLPEAIENYKKALSYYEEDNDSTNMAPILTNIGIIYFDLEKYDLSLQYTQSAYKIFTKHNNTVSSAMSANNLGDVYQKRGELDLAVSYYEKALNFELANKNNYGIGFELFSLGEVEFSRGNFKVALDYFLQSRVYRSAIKSQSELGETDIYIGKTYYSMGNLVLAKQYCQQGFAVAEEINSESSIRDGALVLSNIYEKMKKFDQALYYHKKYSNVKDSLIKRNNLVKMTRVSMQYEYDKKSLANEMVFKSKLEHQASLRYYLILFSFFVVLLAVNLYLKFRLKRNANIALTARNRIISEQKEVLEKSGKELTEAINTKNKFFSIIAHDIKNPFHIILGYSDMLNNDFDALKDEERKMYLSEIDKAAKLTFDLLENLLVWANGQQGKIKISKENVRVSELVKNALFAYLQVAEKKSISVTTQIPDDLFVFADQITLTMVVGNLFHNAIKFTHRNGEIKIIASQNPESVQISILDNGVGMNSSVMENLFRLDKSISTPGTEHEMGTGLGLILCKDFVDRNGGVLEVQSTEGKGSNFTIVLPGEF